MRTIRTEAGRRVFFTSDTHYGHRNILAYCRRPFLEPEAFSELDAGRRPRDRFAVAREASRVSDAALDRHDSYLAGATNAVVGEADLLIHCGDVARSPKHLRDYRDRLRVREVYVVVGNHDSDANVTEEDLVDVFGRARVAERFHFEIDGPGGLRKVVADHYAGDVWRGSQKGTHLVFGHSHGGLNAVRAANPAYLLSKDVGVDSHDYRPWSWQDELLPLFDRLRPRWQEWRDRAYPPRLGKGG